MQKEIAHGAASQDLECVPFSVGTLPENETAAAPFVERKSDAYRVGDLRSR